MEKITQSQSEMHDKIDRDAFDTLSEKEPEKFLKLQNSLVQFVNGHLDKLNLSGLKNLEKRSSTAKIYVQRIIWKLPSPTGAI